MSESMNKPSMEEVVDFLLGVGPIEGLWWGETAPEMPRFWWRRHLSEAWDALTRAETPKPGEREAVVAWLRGQMIACFDEGVSATGPASDHFYSMRDAYRDAADAIERRDHLSARQAPTEGEVK